MITREKKDANWKGRVELSYANKGGGRWTYLTNNRQTPYITYAQMQDKLKDWLNDGESASPLLQFGTVTVEENGAAIHGKYSFPGAERGDAGRAGLPPHYPDAEGRGWKNCERRTLRALAHQRPVLGANAGHAGSVRRPQRRGRTPLTVKLYQYPAVTNTTTPPEITLVNGTDGQTSDLLGVGTPQYDSTAKRWTVTFTGTGRTGLVIARAKLGGHTAEMTIDVRRRCWTATRPPAACRCGTAARARRCS